VSARFRNQLIFRLALPSKRPLSGKRAARAGLVQVPHGAVITYLATAKCFLAGDGPGRTSAVEPLAPVSAQATTSPAA